MMQSGQVVSGKYRLNQILGSGGMADVWSATNTFTDREFAIKFMHDSVAKTQEAVDRFLQEAKVSARINHPNVIEIIDVGQTDDGKLFLVMELLTGMSLETALRKQNPSMTLTELSFVMIEVARALSAAHRCGVIHRDLKPSNIYLHKDRQGNPVPKVLDFGVSKFLEDERSRSNTALTVQGTVLGSPLYMSPEQARGEVRVDGRSDIFSFGAILFEAMCGYRAFDGNNFNALIVQIATGKPKSIDECAPHLPESLRAVVRKCLETERVSRPANFDVVASDLMNALPELENANVHVPAPPSGVIALDPDATNALPLVRASDRPPPSAPAYGGGELDGADTPEIAALGRTAMVRPHSTFTPQVVLVAGLVFFSAIVMAAVAYALFQRVSTPVNAAPSAPVVVVSPPPSVDVSGTPINELPKVARKGVLSIVAKGPNCFVAVDGARIGKTPISSVELSPGPHQLDCTTADGRTRGSKVNIQGGASDTYTFETK
jgi:eukaryotic-like serine/threonine-protein kinase